MNIIYLHQYFKFPDEQGGTRSYDLASSFAKNGIRVHVVTATSDNKFKSGKRWHTIFRDGLHVHYIYLPYSNRLSYFKRSIVFLKFLWFSTFRLFRLKANLVLATSTPLTIGIPALLCKWFGGKKYIFEVRDVWPEAVIAIGAIQSKVLQKVLYLLEKIIYQNASAIITLSIDMRASIQKRYPALIQKSRVVIENISEINRFQRNSLAEEIRFEDILGFRPRFVILYAGTFGKVNGLEFVVGLAEMTLTLDKSLVYLLLGEGAEKEFTIQLAKEKGVLNQNLFVLDPISKNELPAWYAAASMGSSFVTNIKELWANSANKFFDTLAARKPILINHGGWQAEIIQRQNIGYVLPSVLNLHDAQRFVAYTNDSDLHISQCNNAFQEASESYSLETATRKYLDVFKSLTNVHVSVEKGD